MRYVLALALALALAVGSNADTPPFLKLTLSLFVIGCVLFFGLFRLGCV